MKKINMWTKTTTQDVKMMSLYEYLGKAAGPKLGKEVAEAAIKNKVHIDSHEVSNPKYTGKILKYPKTFLDAFFNKKTATNTIF